MSWLARSIADSLNLTDPDPGPADDSSALAAASSNPNSIPESPRGVKEDLSELKNTLSRQLRGVASFLAPPPTTPHEGSAAVKGGNEEGGSDVIEGMRSDFAEIGGKFRSGISRISNNKSVWEFTKMASSLLQLGEEDEEEEEEEGVLGVSEETVAFVRNVTSPETWLDFPIINRDEDNDFELSDAQYGHALEMEKHAPGLASLRMELCPGYMTEGCFWKIYFVLLHPWLKKEDAAVLSTQQVMELRVLLMQELQSHNSGKPKSDQTEGGALFESDESSHKELLSVPLSSAPLSEIVETSSSGTANSNVDPVTKTEKLPIQAGEIHVSGKAVDGEKQFDVDQVKHQRPYPYSSSLAVEDMCKGDGDDWLKEDTSETAEIKGTSTINIENDEDMSFSDLEDDDGDIPSTYKVVDGSDSSTRDSRDWVKLGGSSDDSTKDVNASGRNDSKTNQDVDTEESNDWLNVDDIHQV